MNDTARRDAELKARLKDAGQRTAEDAPPFAPMWSRALAHRRSRRRRGLRLRLSVAAALLVVSTLLVHSQVRERIAFKKAKVVAMEMSQWRAPLDFLLQTPGREWLEATPSLNLLPGIESDLSLPPEEVLP
jgi:hypothetical protein